MTLSHILFPVYYRLHCSSQVCHCSINMTFSSWIIFSTEQNTFTMPTLSRNILNQNYMISIISFPFKHKALHRNKFRCTTLTFKSEVISFDQSITSFFHKSYQDILESLSSVCKQVLQSWLYLWITHP